MSEWKSRWSWVRLVNTRDPEADAASARPSRSACEETSIAQARSPASSIARNVAWRSIASGVVRSTSASTPPITLFTVPSRPVCTPVRSSMWRTRNAVVVFPFVPVMPATRSSAVGSPLNARGGRRHRGARVGARAPRSRPGRAGARRPAPDAPASTAGVAKSCPSAVAPGTQKNSVPGPGLAVVVGEARDLSRHRRPRSRHRAPSSTSRSSIAGDSKRGVRRRRAYAGSDAARERVGRDVQVRQGEVRDLAERRARRRRRRSSCRTVGESTTTVTSRRGSSAGAKPTNEPT